MEQAVTGLYQRAGRPPPLPPADLARLLVAVGAGARLEQAAEPGSSPAMLLAGQLARLIAGRPATSVSAPDGKESHDHDHR
jgi:hypothetical protein